MDFTLWKVRRHPGYPVDDTVLYYSAKKKYGGRSNMFSMRVHHNGVFKYWPGRIYVGGMETLVDLIDVDSVSVEELDAIMYELGYELGSKNYYYFVKPGSNLDDGLYSLSESANLKMLKDLVDDHKMIEVYVENGKTTLDVDQMPPKSIRTVIADLDATKKKAALS